MHPYFAKRGPSFNSEVISEIGRILGRKDAVPSAETIFKNMPLGERIEDNLHPVDPDEGTEASKSARNGQWNRRMRGPQENEDSHGNPAVLSSVRAATTMDTSSSFTMASLPGFTTAGAHRSALAAVGKEAAAVSVKESMPQAQIRRAGTTKRPADQPSVRGFFAKRQKSDPTELTSPPRAPEARPMSRQVSMTARMPQQRIAEPEPALPSIAPDLTGHRLGASKFARPMARIAPGREDPRKAYPNFSSSPPREKAVENVEKIVVDGEDEDVVRGPRERPANCLHVTTATAPQTYGGFTRPGMIKKEGGIAPIDRLRKPFKPLTINKGKR